MKLVCTLVCLVTGLVIVSKCLNTSTETVLTVYRPDCSTQIFVLSRHIQSGRSFCFSRRPKGKGGTVLYPNVSCHSKLLIITLLLLSGDVETNPGPDSTSSTFPCGHCEVDANWTNGGIACDNCDIWYHRDCADMNLSSFNRLANTSLIWICEHCN